MAFPALTGFLNPAFNWLGSSAGNPSAVSNVAGKIGNAFTGANGTGGWNWLGGHGIIPVGLAGLQTLGGLGDLWLGMKNYNLAKDAYDFQTALANRNLANQAKIINNVYDVAGRVGAALSNQNWDGTIDKNALAASEEQAKRQHVDGSYIG